MKVLTLHPQDRWTSAACSGGYDLVVDLGRAPFATYEGWSCQAGCPVIGLSDFADTNGDLYHTRSHVQMGATFVTDRMGIDWWSVLSLEIVPQLQQLILIQRLARHINEKCDIYSSRADYRSAALHEALGGRLINLETAFRGAVRRLRYYFGVASKFNSRQIFQIAQDKFDKEHAIRRRLAKRGSNSVRSPILLPSAYINVSRTALSYAELLPDEQFLLVCARDSAKVQDLPANVRMISLNPYFSSPNAGDEISSLLEKWATLKKHLISHAPEFQSGAAVGLFDRIPSLIRWGITLRDAWIRLFECENIRSCFCADHSNPYTRIPLLLAKRAGVPALACHHGALDAMMATTTHDADFYVAKSEMERDYMTRVCSISQEKVVAVRASDMRRSFRLADSQDRPWLVFFSEPYEVSSWRTDEVYGELLPQLFSLSETCGLKLVFKLHPFETVKSHRKLLRRHLPAEKARQIAIISGPISEQIWQNTRFALTGQSSIALECVERNVPIFLCGWLRDPFCGYVEQYQRFGVGHLLGSAAEISDIPRLLASQLARFEARQNSPDQIGAEILKELLATSHPLPIAAGS